MGEGTPGHRFRIQGGGENGMTKRREVRARLILGDQFKMVDALDRTEGEDAAVVASTALDVIEGMKAEADATILRADEVMYRVGLSKPTIYERMKRGTFPQSIPLGGEGRSRGVGWLKAEIDVWVSEQASRRSGGA
jgi:prophage regulatory protein